LIASEWQSCAPFKSAPLPPFCHCSFPNRLLSKQSVIVSTVLTQDFLALRDATPDAIQRIGLLVDAVQSHLHVFAGCVVNYQSKPKFDFLWTSAVPALFSHFVPKESIEAATIFHTHVTDIARPKTIAVLLGLFFCSLSTFRFLEAVLTPFTVAFGSDKAVASLLGDFAVQYLLQLFPTVGWPPHDVDSFFVKTFLLPQRR
jgi:hypothetical protein